MSFFVPSRKQYKNYYMITLHKYLFDTNYLTKERRGETKILTNLIGSLSNDDGDGNENGKKAIGLDKQNNNFARAARFLYISLPSLHDYNVKVPNFRFCRGREHKTTTFVFFSWTLRQSFRIQLQNILPSFDEFNEME